MKPLIVGELNPYGGPDEFALWPAPRGCSGERLCRYVLGLEPEDYLERFDRANLLDRERWSVPLAREAAGSLLRIPGRDVFILLGARVSAAFGFSTFLPFTHGSRHLPACADGCAVARSVRIAVLPHPSGLCRLWNAPDAVRRARATVASIMEAPR